MSDLKYGDDNLSKDEIETIFSKSNSQIVKMLNKRSVRKDPHHYFDSNKFTKTLHKEVANDPFKYSNNINPFLSIHQAYQYELLRGFGDAWKNGKELDWANIFSFIDKLINSNIFWKEAYNDEDYNFREWILGIICELIESGTRRDDHSFSSEYLPNAKSILLLIESKTKFIKVIESSLEITILNSSRGKLYDSLMNYCLRYARVYNEENKFESDIQFLFDSKLKNDKDLVFYYTIGKYIGNVIWLNKEWLFKNFNRIFSKEFGRSMVVYLEWIYVLFVNGLQRNLFDIKRKWSS